MVLRAMRKRGRPPKAKTAPRARKPRNTWEALMQARAALAPRRNIYCIGYLDCLDHYTKHAPGMTFTCRLCCLEGDRRRKDDPFDGDEWTELLAICRLLLAIFYDREEEPEERGEKEDGEVYLSGQRNSRHTLYFRKNSIPYG